MRIETKLNIGDVGYFMTNNQMYSSAVKQIETRTIGGVTDTTYTVANNPAGDYKTRFDEDEIFGSIDDLFQSLKNNLLNT